MDSCPSITSISSWPTVFSCYLTWRRPVSLASFIFVSCWPSARPSWLSGLWYLFAPLTLFCGTQFSSSSTPSTWPSSSSLWGPLSWTLKSNRYKLRTHFVILLFLFYVRVAHSSSLFVQVYENIFQPFGVSKRQFKKVADCASIRQLKRGEHLAVETIRVETISILLSGRYILM